MNNKIDISFESEDLVDTGNIRRAIEAIEGREIEVDLSDIRPVGQPLVSIPSAGLEETARAMAHFGNAVGNMSRTVAEVEDRAIFGQLMAEQSTSSGFGLSERHLGMSIGEIVSDLQFEATVVGNMVSQLDNDSLGISYVQRVAANMPHVENILTSMAIHYSIELAKWTVRLDFSEVAHGSSPGFSTRSGTMWRR